MPVLFEFDGAYFYLSGSKLKYSERFQDVSANSKVTLLVDDVDSPTRWVPRGVEITGEAESREKGNYPYVRIKPVGTSGWGVKTYQFSHAWRAGRLDRPKRLAYAELASTASGVHACLPT